MTSKKPTKMPSYSSQKPRIPLGPRITRQTRLLLKKVHPGNKKRNKKRERVNNSSKCREWVLVAKKNTLRRMSMPRVTATPTKIKMYRTAAAAMKTV